MISAKILVIHQGAIGDLVLSLPALQTIKKSFPGRSCEMLGYPGILSLVSADVADTIRSADWAPTSTLYGDFDDVSAQMRQYLEGFDRIFIFSARDTSAFIENIQRCHPGAVHIRTFPAAQQHVIDFQLAQLAALNLRPACSVPQLRISDHDHSRADQYLVSHGLDAATGLLIAVHAGSGGRHKCWPPASFVSVMQQLHEKRPAFFLILQGPADEKTAGKVQKSIADLPHEKLENFDLPLIAALLSRCALFIGNDSGMTHLAAAAGAPTIAVFGPTDPAVWGPRGTSVSIVRRLDASGQWLWQKPEAVVLNARRLLSQC